MSRRRFRFALLVAAAALSRLAAEPALPPDQVEFFEARIRPLLAEHCYKCHSAEAGKSKGGLTLDRRDALRKGGGSGVVLVPGDPDKSLLIAAVRYTDEDLQMPPKDEGGRLSDEQIALLETWVRMGAPDPRSGGAPDPLDLGKARQHWAFQPIVKPAPPAVRHSAWVATPVDAFILAKLEDARLAPAPAADPRTLLRRVTYDLTGLPPTPGEMEAFLADRTPEAYARAVDRLLASPHYGERWGRYWLDVARYADTKGYLAGNVERRYAFSHTYRDYVIDAFNADKPFDRFIVEQIAADHLPLGEDQSALAALGFLTLGRRFLNNQNDIIDDRIDVVTRGLMGLTVSCARCHDHKFDPVPTTDYYALHGVFASSEEPVEKPLLGPLVDSPAYQEFLGKQAEIDRKIEARTADEVAKFLTGVREKTGDYLLAAHDARRLPEGGKIDTFAGGRKLNVTVLQRWQTYLAAPDAATHPALAPWFALAALPATDFPEQARRLIEGWNTAGSGINPVVAAELAKDGRPPESLADAAAAYNRVFAALEKAEPPAAAGSTAAAPAGDAGREELRRWLRTDGFPSNLGQAETAALLKRQIDGKVAGLRREREALNWTEPGAPRRAMALADKANPKDSKVLLRGNPANPGPDAPRRFLTVLAADGAPRPLIRGSGRLDLAEEIASPQNPLTARVLVNRIWGWHFGEALVRTPSDFGVRTEAPEHRALLDWLAASFLEGGWSVKRLHRTIVLSQTYRQSSDAAPAATAADPDNRLVHHFTRRRLDMEAMRDTLLAVAGTLDRRPGGLPDDVTKEPFTTRRTVYGFIDRQSLPGMYRVFDYPNPDVSSAGRFATTVPQQALFLMNSPFAQEQARQLVRRAEVRAARTDREKLAVVHRILYQRSPDKEETRLALAFLQRPATAIESLPLPSAGWSYGRGSYAAEKDRVVDFQPLPVRKEGRLTPAQKSPDPVYGRLSLTANGGHPGKTPAQAGVRRWTAPGKGRIIITGTLGHDQAGSDGVRGRIVSSEGGRLGEWTVLRQKAETNLEHEVQGGETIDFIVDCLGTDTADTYTWAPTIAFRPDDEAIDLTARTWDAKKDFEVVARPPAPLTRWEELAQVLLLANELVFVD